MSLPGTGRALVVGIDDYPRFDGTHRLFGAAADAVAVADYLVKAWGFERRHVTLLLNEAAARRPLLEALDELRDRAAPGDRVVFYFSGHGSQMTDREGDEGDGLDETLVPHDSGRGSRKNRDVTDDEIHFWTRDVLEITRDLVLIFDCCHSGTLHRPGWRSRSVPPDLRPATELPPSPVAARVRRDVRGEPEPLKLSACADHEQAWELPPFLADGVFRGAFTFHLLRVLEAGGPKLTWRAALERTAAALRKKRVGQRPEGSGPGFDGPVTAEPSAAERASRGERLLAVARSAEPWEVRVKSYRSGRGPWRALGEKGFRAGDRVRLDLRHHEDRRLFVYVLDVGLTGSLDLVFPDRHGHESVDPGLELRIGVHEVLELYLPDDFPAEHASGEGRLVLVGSPKPLSTAALLGVDEGLLGAPEIRLAVLPYRLRR